jgi:hypothetical protein
VPKTVASGTRSLVCADLEESVAWRKPNAEPFGTSIEEIQ